MRGSVGVLPCTDCLWAGSWWTGKKEGFVLISLDAEQEENKRKWRGSACVGWLNLSNRESVSYSFRSTFGLRIHLFLVLEDKNTLYLFPVMRRQIWQHVSAWMITGAWTLLLLNPRSKPDQPFSQRLHAAFGINSQESFPLFQGKRLWPLICNVYDFKMDMRARGKEVPQ